LRKHTYSYEIFHAGGYVLSRASVTPNELAEFKDNAALAGLWPPTFIVHLDIGNDDAIHRSNARTLQGGTELAWRSGAREEATAEDGEGKGEGGIQLPSFDPLVPLESLEALQDGLSKYGVHNEALEKLVTSFGFDEGRRQMLQVDATQSREEVLEIVLHGVAQQRHTTKPQRLEVENFKVAADGTFQEVVSTIELETEGVVVQEVCGVFQRFDPVEFKTMRKLVEGSGDLTASYQGATYFFATPTNLEKFLACPTPYLGAPEMPTDYVIALVGAPKCGKSTVAEALEMQFGFTRLTMDLVGPDVLSAGGRLVLDGCPGSAEELEELKERGLGINLVVYLTVSDVELLVARGRDVDASDVAEGEEEGANPQDEELLNRAKQFEDDLWPTLQGSVEVAELRQVEIDGLQPEAEVLRQVRCAMDPFLAYRLKHAGAVITAADVDASAEEGAMRIALAPEVRGLRYLTTNFCPVSLRDEQLLVPGKDDLGLRIGHDCYSVFDDASQQRALKAPRRYHIQAFEDNDKELGPRMPQPRILLVGPRGAGKSTLATSLKTQVRTQRVVSLAAGLPALMRKLVVDLIKADKVRVAEEVVQRGLERQERVAIKEAKDIERALSAAALEAEQAAADQAEEEEVDRYTNTIPLITILN
jgi:adenylate kinase family enzyme/YHS domain-containing protein